MAIQSIEFEISNNEYTLKDAIVFDNSVESYTLEQIDAMKQKRFDDWYAIVTAPTVEE
jgi:hypothetical protein